MMRRTHEAFAGVWWLGLTAAVDGGCAALGHPPVVSVTAVALGWPAAIPFSAGHNSPDGDQLIWPGPPRNHYQWNGHRGITHRVWFAVVVTTVWCVLTFLPFYTAYGFIPMPSLVVPLVLAPVAGWWSHLAGDMIYGRIKIAGRARGLGWETGGLSETGKRRYGGRRYVIDPAAKVCFGLCLGLVAVHLMILTQTS